jgi:chemotaxis protein MotB
MNRAPRLLPAALAILLLAALATVIWLFRALRASEDQALLLQKQAQELQEKNSRLTGQLEQLRADILEKNDTLKRRQAELDSSERVRAKLEEVTRAQLEEINRLTRLSRLVDDGLKDLLERGDFQVETHQGRIHIRLADKILFRSGESSIRQEGQAILMKIASFLNTEVAEAMIMVEGHTDSTPIGEALKTRFPSNWELSAARATAAVRFLEQAGQVNPLRLAAVGRGSTQPIDSGESPEQIARNRRIEIILTLPPASTSSSTPTASPARIPVQTPPPSNPRPRTQTPATPSKLPEIYDTPNLPGQKP